MSRDLADRVRRAAASGAPAESHRFTNDPTDAMPQVARAASTFADPGQLKVMITDKGTPNPALFSGQDKDYSVTAFVQAMERKLAMATLRTDTDGMQLVPTLLKGPAWRLCAPRVPATLARGTCYNPFGNMEEMIDELYKCFGSANAEGEALTAMRQRRSSQICSQLSIALGYGRQHDARSDSATRSQQHLLCSPNVSCPACWTYTTAESDYQC